jgi:8-oxo-dGTP diphosphatase
MYKYAVLAANYYGKWILCRNKERTTWEIPNGRREKTETISFTAKRELFEKTGAVKFNIQKVGVYNFTQFDSMANGFLFYVDVKKMNPLPINSSVTEVLLSDDLPAAANLTYPNIHVQLYYQVINYLNTKLLGLKNDDIKIVPYNYEYNLLYHSEKSKLKTVLSKNIKGIEHVGSTAIVGILARPVIDIAICVDDLKNIDIDGMINYGYKYNLNEEDRCYYFTKYINNQKAYSVYCYDENNREYHDMVTFRDYMKSHPEVMLEYNTLKQYLVQKYGNDAKSYYDGKNDYIKQVLELSKQKESILFF